MIPSPPQTCHRDFESLPELTWSFYLHIAVCLEMLGHLGGKNTPRPLMHVCVGSSYRKHCQKEMSCFHFTRIYWVNWLCIRLKFSQTDGLSTHINTVFTMCTVKENQNKSRTVVATFFHNCAATSTLKCCLNVNVLVITIYLFSRIWKLVIYSSIPFGCLMFFNSFI